jgi:hypothetical protein
MLALMGLCWPFTVDDAYILCRYGRHLAEGRGLVFNPSGAPVEGYSNALYVFFSAGLLRVGLDPVRCFKLLGAASQRG